MSDITIAAPTSSAQSATSTPQGSTPQSLTAPSSSSGLQQTVAGSSGNNLNQGRITQVGSKTFQPYQATTVSEVQVPPQASSSVTAKLPVVMGVVLVVLVCLATAMYMSRQASDNLLKK